MGNRISQKPKPGDLIEIFRGGYKHWAVYVGNDDVVHVTLPPGASRRKPFNCFRSIPTEAMVRKQKLSKVVGGNKWGINNNLDEECKPRSPDSILREANSQVGKMMEYSLIRNNCEHFATKLRYGQAVSNQVRKAEDTMFSGGVVGVSLGMIMMVPSEESETEDNSDTQ